MDDEEGFRKGKTNYRRGRKVDQSDFGPTVGTMERKRTYGVSEMVLQHNQDGLTRKILSSV